jgi:hypothetical protein
MAAQTGATNIVQLPLAFVRSGNVYIDYGRLVSTGYVGDYWSRTANSATTGRDLIFHTTYVNPSLNDNRWNGFPLRCLYPGN